MHRAIARPENLRGGGLENIEIQWMISLFRYSGEKIICFGMKVPDFCGISSACQVQ
jgi:hypothetical protein